MIARLRMAVAMAGMAVSIGHQEGDHTDSDYKAQGVAGGNVWSAPAVLIGAAGLAKIPFQIAAAVIAIIGMDRQRGK